MTLLVLLVIQEAICLLGKGYMERDSNFFPSIYTTFGAS